MLHYTAFLFALPVCVAFLKQDPLDHMVYLALLCVSLARHWAAERLLEQTYIAAVDKVWAHFAYAYCTYSYLHMRDDMLLWKYSVPGGVLALWVWECYSPPPQQVFIHAVLHVMGSAAICKALAYEM